MYFISPGQKSRAATEGQQSSVNIVALKCQFHKKHHEKSRRNKNEWGISRTRNVRRCQQKIRKTREKKASNVCLVSLRNMPRNENILGLTRLHDLLGFGGNVLRHNIHIKAVQPIYLIKVMF